ncbi:MAG: hypothetical protein ABSA21_08100 [Candidatus Limnocylindrales bacterium]|jgi:putative SOS response-associated peptidase YedK
MRVILPELDWDRWLDPTVTDAASFFDLLGPAPDDLLEAVPVGSLVNSARNQGPELVRGGRDGACRLRQSKQRIAPAQPG